MHRIDPIGPRQNTSPVTGVRPVGERREPAPDRRQEQPAKKPPQEDGAEGAPPEDGEVRHIDVQA